MNIASYAQPDIRALYTEYKQEFLSNTDKSKVARLIADIEDQIGSPPLPLQYRGLLIDIKI